jgi:hypothetical protein
MGKKKTKGRAKPKPSAAVTHDAKKDVQRCCFLPGCDSTTDLKSRTRCKVAHYCSKKHQISDWKRHKKWCQEAPSDDTATEVEWWKKDHQCEYCAETHPWNKACGLPPGAREEFHEGKPELMLWALDKEAKSKFESEFHGNEEALASYRSDYFRWNCCGTSVDSCHPCDHHGRGSQPCSCDFCVGGKQTPKRQTMENYGLDLCWAQTRDHSTH